MEQKKVVTIQDISCFGKCSLTVALPVISAMGLSCAVIPTAVLSTHTGGFTGFTFHSLTDDIPKIADHWEREGIAFDGISTGYLGDERQIEIVSDFIGRFGRGKLVFVDPAMADAGVLYKGFDMDFVKSMRTLCERADVTVPNITEAALLTGTEYREEGYGEDYILDLLHKLVGMGAGTAVITGVCYDGKNEGAVAYDGVTGEITRYFTGRIPTRCHGTGDVFAAVLFGALVLGYGMEKSLRMAVEFTVDSIRKTVGDETHWYGVKFEQAIPGLIDMLRDDG